MTNNFRDLCAELLDEVVARPLILDRELIARASAALADVPDGREPAAVTGQPRPTEDDVEDAAQCIYEAMRFERVETTPAWSELGNSLAQDTARKAARAVLARWGNHVPAPPADGEVAELVAWLKENAEDERQMSGGDNPASLKLDRAAELLQRQVLVPVSVSERLPGAEETTEDGEVWIGDPGHDYPLADTGDYDWEPHRWVLRQIGKFDAKNNLHWLPAHALPLPEADK